ncbi:MAG: PQ-loop repeat-containing protein [Gammaproteobacteria bacterium]
MIFNTEIKNFIEVMFSLGLFFNAMLFVPQIVKLLRTKSAKGLSLLTFAGFSVLQIFTILHAYITKDYILFFGFLLSLLFCGTVTILIIAYRKNHCRANQNNSWKKIYRSMYGLKDFLKNREDHPPEDREQL